MIGSYRQLADDIFTIEGLLEPEDCDELIAFAEGIGFAEAPVTTAQGQIRVERLRNNDRVMADDPRRAANLWELIRDRVPSDPEGWEAIGVNERLRLYRYDPGQQFDWHRDGYFERAPGERSRLTFMIYLNEVERGGETDFEDVTVTPKKGLGIVFAHPLLHRGRAVEAGRKYVLRTDVMYRWRGP